MGCAFFVKKFDKDGISLCSMKSTSRKRHLEEQLLVSQIAKNWSEVAKNLSESVKNLSDAIPP